MKGRILATILVVAISVALLAVGFRAAVAENGRIYIRADGSVEPPDASITTLDNVTYTLTGDITSSDDGISVERDNIIIDGNGYTVQGALTFFSRGIILMGRSNVTIKNTRITTFHYGITTLDIEPEVASSSYGNISGNNIANNWDGIYLSSSSGYSISGNNITANDDWGIRLSFSSVSSISGNSITANGLAGIYLEFCSGSSIGGNDIANNGCGVQLAESSGNTIVGNNVRNNEYGVMLDWSPGNKFYHNNFDNTNQVFSSDSIDVWNDSYPSGGNYWSDYVGVDKKCGPTQSQPGSDGIGDTQHILDDNNFDRYPLVKPYALGNLSISICTDKYTYHAGDKTHLSLNVSNPDSAKYVCFAIWVTLPDNSVYVYMHKHSVILPIGLHYTSPSFQTITLPYLPHGMYRWHAAFLERTTHAAIVEDTAEWQFN